MNIIAQNPSSNDPVEKGIAAYLDEIIALRHDLHQYPELAFQELRTSKLVASRLSSWGYEVATGIAGTGIVATLRRGEGKKRIGIRADMDALPIEEATGLAYASSNPGVMHACGHDGHTSILLAAARYLAESGNFSGTLRLIFQPAEEIGAGARKMISEGLFERFPVDAVFGLHNWPGVPTGQFGFVAGPAMASVDKAIIKIIGKGGHGAEPHRTVDPVLASASFITALQSVVSRNVDPQEMAVVTVGSIHAGSASNVIPESVEMQLTMRAYNETVRQLLRERIPALARAQAESFGAEADVNYRLGFPALINHAAETAFARDVADDALGLAAIEKDFRPRTASEDFAFMLQANPGSYLFVGNGDSAPLHSAHYNFNDAIIAPAARYWVRLAETFLTDDNG
ncbi:M20 aminoacylase family protein [Rhizobium brockwellii]|uniref:M20 aminoacylase family protein n=1 Tax=Rhizobium brockwellii TaxID=3019932 RepID=A0ABU3YQ61_9HYPH|nr:MULTISPECIES: M20 aminoacylase family protein [Rhizobium]MDV4180546.1 M20 aminoacylase family protein [Rhizobium brockwellii]MDV4187978.1 M20 aminoacylase family protein [Rhizobium brockwellii]TAV43214.1 amidohydrolase [Rhizobium leguminosarum]TAV43238.1 amidohydrolase [Rhizobium leguminosarum]TAV62084.1 amidohydrolase [Rhizobium leguminosarum]